jgi:ligand-binding SRPBCC domain-containing protein
MKLLFETPIKLPFETVRDKFNRDLFIYLSPPGIPFDLKKFDGCKKGDEVHIDLGFGFLKQKWVSEITFEETNEKGWSFIDEGRILPWPLKSWRHHHRVDKISDTECVIADDIEYECITNSLTILMKPFLWSVFSIRPKRYKHFFKVEHEI